MTQPNKLAIALHEAAITLENDSSFIRRYRDARTPVNRMSTFSIRRECIIKHCRYASSFQPRFGVDIDHTKAEQLRRYFDDTLKMPPAENPNAFESEPTLEFWLDEVRYPDKKTADTRDRDRQLITNAVSELHNKVGFFECFIRSSSRRNLVAAHLQASGWALMPNEVLDKIVDRLNEELPAFQPAPTFVPKCPIPIPSPEYLAEWKAQCKAINAEADALLASLPQPNQEPTMAKTPVITINTKTFVNGTDIATMDNSEVYALIASEEKAIAELESIKAKPKRLVDELAKRQAGIAALVAHLDSQDAA